MWKYPAAADGGEATNVPTFTSIRVQFDRFLAPESAVRQAICVQAATVGMATAEGQCIGGLVPEYDPVDRVAVWKGVSLLPNQRYNVRLLLPTSPDDTTNGIRAFDGVPLEKEYTFAFTTGTGMNPEFVEPNRSTINFCSNSTYCQLSGACMSPNVDVTVRGPNNLLTTCGTLSACHANPPNGKAGVPVGSALVLNDTTGGVPAAVTRLVTQGVVATEAATGADTTVAHRSASNAFGQNMPVIDAKNPGNSFLLYKLILSLPPRCMHPMEESPNRDYDGCNAANFRTTVGSEAYLCKGGTACAADGGVIPAAGATAGSGEVPPIVPSWVPADKWQPPVEGEYSRLRSRIRGDSMSAGGPNSVSAYNTVIALSAWIAAGATTVQCAP